MPRVQALVIRDNRILMVRHHQDGVSWWCLPGGALEPGETPAQGALRELAEECQVRGRIVRQVSHHAYSGDDDAITFLVDIGDQTPLLGLDPEVDPSRRVLAGLAWMSLREIPARDRTYLWASGLHAVPAFLAEIEAWGDQTCYPEPQPPEEDRP